MPSSDPGLYCNQAMYLSCMGMIRPGLQDGDGHHYRNELCNAPLSIAYQYDYGIWCICLHSLDVCE